MTRNRITPKTKYAFFDGDNVGDTLEMLLNENKVKEAAYLSKSIKDAMESIENWLISTSKVKILICGGDDLLIEYKQDDFDPKLLNTIMEMFFSKTNHTMSCGLGYSPSEATRSLYLAKLYGKHRIYGE